MALNPTQQQMKADWQTVTQAKSDAKDALKKAKMEIPQDPDKVAQAQEAYNQASQAVRDQRSQEKEYNKGLRKQTREAIKEDVKGLGKKASVNSDIRSGYYEAGASLGRDVGAVLKGKPTGNEADVKAATYNAAAQDLQNSKANRDMEAQASQQIANRNEFDEASKIASVQNNAENKQNINNLSAAAGNSAALMRKTNTPDVQTQAARQDTQRNVATQQREKADTEQIQSTYSKGAAKSQQVASRDYDQDIDESARLSLGEGGAEDEQTGDDTGAEDNPNNDSNEAMPSGNPQHVINWLLGSSKGQDVSPQAGAEGDNGLAAWVQEKFGVQPATLGQYDGPDDKEGETFEKKWLADPNAPGDKQGAIQALRQGRVGEGNDASRNFSSKDYDQMNQNMQVTPSDRRIKSLERELSDFRMKCIKEDWDRYGAPSEDDFEWLLRKAGKLRRNDRDYGLDDEDDWEDELPVVDAYARHIRNYVYNYKPEAVEIDPSIDPSEEHIGPMAQDIEQVNPACIKETNRGVKTVDTSRLALMNAGAIGDLARQLQELNDKLNMLIGGR